MSTLNQPTYDRCWAVLVGVNDYDDTVITNLTVCADDAQAIYDLVTTRGYEPEQVRVLRSPGQAGGLASRTGILAALTSVTQAAAPQDIVLFYFSGHGIVHGDQAYLLPADTHSTVVADTAINLERIKAIMQASPARAKVMILDACHAGAPIGKAFSDMTKDFVRHVFEEAEGMAILASSMQQQRSWEFPDRRRSVFTHYLLEGLSGAADRDNKGFVTVGDINAYVTDKVKTWAVQNSRVQVPTLEYTVAGDIVLLSSASSAAGVEGGEAIAKIHTVISPSTASKAVDVTSSKEQDVAGLFGEVGKSTITWLHLSDLHFNASSTYNRDVVLDALLQDIGQRIDVDHVQPDFIVISGDLAFSGQHDDYDLVRAFLDDLLDVTNLPKARLFLVPGNHDVDRQSISPLAARAAEVLNDRDTVLDLMGNRDDCALIFERFRGYRDFLKEYGLDSALFDDETCSSVQKIQIGGLKVALLGFNSAWLSASDEDRNHLVLGERPVRSALEMTEDADLRIAVLHHPFDWLRDFDRRDVEALLCDHCDYVLHGHMHQPGLLQMATPDNKAMIIAAGACYETRTYPNSYNFVQLDLAKGEGTVYLRMYSDQRGGFWTKDVASYRNVPDGLYSFATGRSKLTVRHNPFIYGRAVQSDEFLDRAGVLSTLFSRIRNGESVAIVGEPHIGKTSLFLKLMDDSVRRSYLGDDSQSRFAFSFKDLQPIEDDYSPHTFWEEVLAPLWQHPDWIEDHHRQDMAGRNFSRRFLERIFAHLGRRNLRLVLLLDEFERLLEHPNFQAPSFFPFLRSLASRTGGLVLLTASRESVATMTQRLQNFVGSPFFNIMIEMRLRPFDESTITDLLSQAGGTISSLDRVFIRRVAGRHPFLLQALAATFWETRGQGRYARAAGRFYDYVLPHFDDVWQYMEDRSRVSFLLLALLELGGPNMWKLFNHNEIQRADHFGFGLSHMVKHGLVHRVGDICAWNGQHLVSFQGGRWTLEAQVFAWWVRDVVITGSRLVPAYDSWQASKRYRTLLSEEEWGRLLRAVRASADWVTLDATAMAGRLAKTLSKESEL